MRGNASRLHPTCDRSGAALEAAATSCRLRFAIAGSGGAFLPARTPPSIGMVAPVIQRAVARVEENRLDDVLRLASAAERVEAVDGFEHLARLLGSHEPLVGRRSSTNASATVFTRIPCGASSIARFFVSAWRLACAAEYAIVGVAVIASIAHIEPPAGGRAPGGPQELYNDSQEVDVEQIKIFFQQMAGEYPNTATMIKEITHDADTTLGWCEDQFEFALDLLLDGLERLRNTDERRAESVH